MITSGHAVILEVDQRLRHYSLGNSTHITMFTDAVATAIDSGNVDAAFTSVTDPDIVINNDKIETANGTLIDVIEGSLFDVDIEQPLSVFGIYSETTNGMLLFNNASFSFIHNDGTSDMFFNMGIGYYNSTGGDSGAPVIYNAENGTNYLIGIHKGTMCNFDHNLLNDQLIPPITTTLCNGNDVDDAVNDVYRVFSAWENVKTAFSLR